MAGVVADKVVVELEAKLDRYNANVLAAMRTWETSTTSISRNADRMESTVGKSLRGIGGALAGVSAFALARQFLEIADSAKQVDAQLRLATRSFGTFGQAQTDVQRIAADTRTGLVETSSLYGNLSRATSALGGTQDQAARATETFSKALKIGGANTQNAAAATLQFGQALASGVLRGDEFNSIAEASPRILKLLADALGVPQGELRALAEQGKLTSDLLFKALTDRRFTAGIDDEFKTLPVTFGEAMQQVENAAIITFGAFDRGGQFSTALSNFITGGSDGFADLAAAAEREGVNIRAAFEGLRDAFSPLLAGANGAFAGIRQDANYTRETIANLLSGIDQLRNFLPDIQNRATAFDNRIKGALNTAMDRAGRRPGDAQFQMGALTPRSNLEGDFRKGARRSEAASRRDAAARRLESKGFIVPRRADGSVDEANIRRAPQAKAAPRPLTGGAKDVKKYTDLNADLEKLKNGASARELKTINAKIAKNNEIISNLNQGVSLSAATAAASGAGGGGKGKSAETLARAAEAARLAQLRNDESFEREKAGLNQDLLRAQRANTTAADVLVTYALQEIEAERVRQNQSYERDVSEKKLTQARADELVALNDRVAKARKEAINAAETERLRRAQVDIAAADLENARDLAAAQSSLAVTVKDRRDAALRLLDLEYQIEQAKLEEVIASKDSTAAEKEIARRRLALLPQLKTAETEATKRQNEGPIGQYRRGLDDPRTQVEQAVVDKLKSIDEGVTDAISKRLGVKDPFLKQLLGIFVQQNLLKPIFDAVQGGIGQAGGGGGIGGYAGGGIGGGTGVIKNILGGITGAATSKVSFGSSGLGTFVKGLFGGRASGGHVNAGQVYRVTDGEGFQPSGSGKIIPLGRMRSGSGGGGVTIFQPVTVDASNSVNPDGYADHIVSRVREETVAIVGRAAAVQSKALPGRLAQFQTDGT